MEKTPSLALSVRFKHRSESSAKNDLRHDLRRGPQPRYIDGNRSHLNSVIIEPVSPSVLRDLCAERRGLLDMKRKRKITESVASSFIVTFGTGLQKHVDALSANDQDALYVSVGAAITDHLGIEMTGLVAHRDETGHHAHGQAPARHPDGRPMGKVITRQIASQIQDIAMEAASSFLPMIERGKRKVDRIADGDDPSTIYNRSVKQLHDDLPAEIEKAEAELVVATDRVREMQDRVDKLAEKISLNVKETKRLATYEKRLNDRKATEDKATEEARRLRADLSAKSDAKLASIKQREQALDVRSHVLDVAEAALDDWEKAIEVREAEVEVQETRLRRVLQEVQSLIGDVAERLGVARTLAAISDKVRSVISTPENTHDEPDGPSF